MELDQDEVRNPQKALQVVSQVSSNGAIRDFDTYIQSQHPNIKINSIDDAQRTDLVMQSFEYLLIAIKTSYPERLNELDKLRNDNQRLEQRVQRAEKNKPGAGAPSDKNFNGMIDINKKVISIQASWRRVMALRKVAKEIDAAKRTISLRKQLQNPEERSIREFNAVLKRRNLTAEAFYRICDKDYLGRVNVNYFKDVLQKMNVVVSKATLSRLILMFDENLEGVITREEYYNTLEAYGIQGEKHKKPHNHTFEQMCLIKLVGVLKKRNIDYMSMYNACDVDDESRAHFNEVQKFVEGLNAGFQQKEIYALMQYLDIDKSKIIEKNDFIRQMKLGEKIYTQYQNRPSKGQSTVQERPALSKPRATGDDDMFAQEDFGGKGTESFAPGAGASASASSGARVSSARGQGNDTKLRDIILRMEEEGLNFNSLFEALNDKSNGGKISLGQIQKQLEFYYPGVPSDDKKYILKQLNVKSGQIDLIELQDVLLKYARNLKPSIGSTFNIIAVKVKNSGLTNKEYFEAKCNWQESDEVDWPEFEQKMKKEFTLPSSDLQEIFIRLNLDQDATIRVEDLLETLESYQLGDQNQISKVTINKHIEQFSELSPRSRQERLIELMNKQLDQQGLKMVNVFKMADSKNTGQASGRDIRDSFNKLCPNISQDIIQESLKAFGSKGQRLDEKITKDEFIAVFSQGASAGSMRDTGMKSTGQSFAGAQPSSDSHMMVIKKLDNAMLNQGLSPSVAFKAADRNQSGTITIDELKQSIMKFLPEEDISLLDINQIMEAFDVNKNGEIDEQEYLQVFNDARATTVVSPEKPKGRIIRDDDAKEANSRRDKLPTRDNMSKLEGERKGDSLQEILEKIKVMDDNLKRQGTSFKSIFDEQALPESGLINSSTISRAFKNTTTLKPGEYMVLIQYLDQRKRGNIDVPSVLELVNRLDKTGKDYPTTTLEFKYMSNVIEYQKKQITAEFLSKVFKIPPEKRFTFIEFQKVVAPQFRIPGPRISLMFEALKRGKDLPMGNDLIIEINKFRSSSIAGVGQKKDTPVSSVEEILRKAVINIRAKRSNMSVDQFFKQLKLPITDPNYEIGMGDLSQTFAEQHSILDFEECKTLFVYYKNRSSSGANTFALIDFYNDLHKSEQGHLSKELKRIVSQMEATQPLQDVVSKLALDDRGNILHYTFKKTLQRVYTGVGDKDIMFVANYLDKEQKAQVKVKELQKFLILYSKKRIISYDLQYKYIGKVLDSTQQPTEQFLQAQGMTKEIFYEQDEFVQFATNTFNDDIDIYDQLYDDIERQGKNDKFKYKDLLVKSINRHRAGYSSKDVPQEEENEQEPEKVPAKKVQEESKLSTHDIIRTLDKERALKDFLDEIEFNFKGKIAMPMLNRKFSSAYTLEKKQIMEYLKSLTDKSDVTSVHYKPLFESIEQNAVDNDTQDIEGLLQDFANANGTNIDELASGEDFISYANFYKTLAKPAGCSQYDSINFFIVNEDDEDQIKVSTLKEILGIQDQAKGGNQKQEEIKIGGSSHPKGAGPTKKKKTVQFGGEEKKEEKTDALLGSKQTMHKMETKTTIERQEILDLFIANIDQVTDIEESIVPAVQSFKKWIRSHPTPNDAIQRIDKNQNGLIELEEFYSALGEILQELTDEQKMSLVFMPIDVHKMFLDIKNFSNTIARFKDYQENQTNFEKYRDVLVGNYNKLKEKTKATVMKSNTGTYYKTGSIEEATKKICAVLSKEENVKKLSEIYHYDEDDNFNYADQAEFFDKMEEFGCELTDEQKDLLIDAIDSDQNGYFDDRDIKRFLFKNGVKIKFHQDSMSYNPDLDKSEADIEIDQYVLTDKDYFKKGCTTILNSLRAALKRCDEIYKETKTQGEGSLYFDTEFGPKDENDSHGNWTSLYFEEEKIPAPGYTHPENVEWIRPRDFQKEYPQFIDNDMSANDVIQGAIGDCWFIGALSVLATRDELLRGGFSNIKITGDMEVTDEIADDLLKGVYPPIFHYYRKINLYVLRFFKDFDWKYVIIDDRLPCDKNTKIPIFGRCASLHELWVPLIEKGYAKLHNCYEALISGFIDDALADMTGLVAEKVRLHNNNGIFPHKNLKDADTFWQTLQERRNEKSLMGCSVTGDTEREVVIDGERTGILTGHAYGLVDIVDLPDPSNQKRPFHRLVRIRNPWGKCEWKGKWSDHSEEMEKYKKIIDDYIEGLDDDEEFKVGEDDGTFLMCYSDFRDIYNNLYITVDFPDNWTGIRFKSSWDQATAGGTPSPMTQEKKDLWAKNPQYYLSLKEDTEVFISLAQPDGRLERGYKFPYKEVIHQVCFTICNLQPREKELTTFDKTKVKIVSTLVEHREVSQRVKLTKGNYMIVPSTFKEGETGQFFLSIYFDKPSLKTITCSRVGNKSDTYRPIKEEQEGDAKVPESIKRLLQKHLKAIIFDEDEGVAKSGLNDSNNLGMSFKELMAKKTSKAKESFINEKIDVQE